MIKFKANALVHSISPLIEVPSKTNGNTFQKRELILNDSYTKDGQDYYNYVLIEFTGDRMSSLDGFAPGQMVTVEACVNGREYQGRYFTTLRGLKISHYVPPQQPHSPQPQQPQQPQAYPQQSQQPQGYTQPQNYPQGQMYPQQYGAYPQQAPLPGQAYPQQYGQPQQPYGQPQQPYNTPGPSQNDDIPF